MVSSTKIKACALVLLIVIVLIQIDSIEAKGRTRIGRIWGRNSKSRWSSSSSRSHVHGVSHSNWARSTGSTGICPSLLLIVGLLTMVTSEKNQSACRDLQQGLHKMMDMTGLKKLYKDVSLGCLK